MAQFHSFHVVRYGPFALCYLHHLVGRHKKKLGILVHKLFDEPGAGHAVYLDMLAGNPFHCMILLLVASNGIDSETNGNRRKWDGSSHLAFLIHSHTTTGQKDVEP